MPRVRFAPSPTGYLHIGNVRTALFNYLFAQREKGSFILRIEDTDKERSRKDFITQIYEDLSWLGITWAEGPDKGGEYGPYLQSERYDIYKKYAEQLIKQEDAYYCYCSADDLSKRKEEQLRNGTSLQDDPCRNLKPEQRAQFEQRGIKPSIRFKIENKKIVVSDIIRGDVEFDLNVIGDFIIMRPDGSPTFHLAVCIDDGLMKVSHVIRGEDHLSNTPKHVLLFKACGFSVPQFAHMPLTMGPGGEPLSKRLGAMSISEYRKKGYLPEALCNYMALLGWASGDDRELFSMEKLEKVFSLNRVSKSAAIFDKNKLDWMCGEHIRLLPDDVYVKRSVQYLVQEKIVPRELYSKRPEWYEKVLRALKDNISNLGDLEDRLMIFDDEIQFQGIDTLDKQSAKQVLTELEKILLSMETFDDDDFDKIFKELKQRTKIKGKGLFLPVRIALTGREHGPELKRIVVLLGKSMCLKRVEACLAVMEE